MPVRLTIPTALDLEEVPVFPLPHVVLLPGALLPLHVFEPRYRQMTRDTLAGRRLLAIARLKPGFEADYHGRPPIYPTCGIGEIVRHELRKDGCYDILVAGLVRAVVREELPATHPYRLVRAKALRDQTPSDPLTLGAWQRELTTLWNKLGPYLPASVRDLCQRANDNESPGAWADRIAAALVADPDARQSLLEELDPAERLARLVERLHELLAALGEDRASANIQLN
ncbi:MAG: LON peptidase substrate-binding domain-containing protein [Myxococcota bacterium]